MDAITREIGPQGHDPYQHDPTRGSDFVPCELVRAPSGKLLAVPFAVCDIGWLTVTGQLP